MSTFLVLKEGTHIIGLVKLIGQHSANIGAKQRYITRYVALYGFDKLKTVLAQTVQSVRPSDIFWISRVVPLRPRRRLSSLLY
jgi:hypothetical protein